MMRVIAFLGAGAALEIGGPTTSQLTNLIRKQRQIYFDPTTKSTRRPWFLRNVSNQLDKYYAPEVANFEDVFHTLEMLDSFRTGWCPGTVKEYKPGIAAFVRPRWKKHFNSTALLSAKQDLINTVADEINRYMNDFLLKKPVWFISFWQRCFTAAKWDVAILNYDACLEKGVGITLEDGFSNTGNGYYYFNPNQILKSSMNRILHLHGCILYGYPRSPHQVAYDYTHEDLYKYDNFSDAKTTWFGRSTNTAQSGEQAIAGPIIVGLRKTDKALCYPYNTYYSLFQNTIIDTPRILIAGYSFGDFHFNRMLERIATLHGKSRRVVLITHFKNPTRWHRDPTVMD